MSDLAPATPSDITPSDILDRLALVSQSIEQIESVAQGVKLREMAEVLRYMAQKAGLAREIALQATKVRIDAERRTGGLLAATPLHKGGRPAANPSHDARGLPTLDDMGLSTSTSSRWQTMAALPDAEYRQFISDIFERDYELSSAAVFRYAQNWLHKHENGQKPERALATWFNEAGRGLAVAVKAMRTVRDIYQWRSKKIRIHITEIEE